MRHPSILDVFVFEVNDEHFCTNKIALSFQANIWLGTLLMERSEDIYRMKGLLSVQGMNERFVFQVTLSYLTMMRLSYGV